MDKKDPTIDEAVEKLLDFKSAYNEMGHKHTEGCFKLAIRALEEMRERENFQPIAQVVGPKEVWVTTDGKRYRRCRLADEDFKITTTTPIPKPHTWDKVTAGEMVEYTQGKLYDFIWVTDAGFYVKDDIKTLAEKILKPKTEPLPTWRSLT